jgi:hypothetical protein
MKLSFMFFFLKTNKGSILFFHNALFSSFFFLTSLTRDKIDERHLKLSRLRSEKPSLFLDHENQAHFSILETLFLFTFSVFVFCTT